MNSRQKGARGERELAAAELVQSIAMCDKFVASQEVQKMIEKARKNK